MTTDLARMEHNAVAVLGNANDALNRLGEWVTAARAARELVAPLVNTPFVPDAYRPKVDPRATDKEKAAAFEVALANAVGAILQGITLGIDPLMALQQIYIVHGRPGMYAKMMVALVQSRGHEVWDEDVTDTRAVVCGRRKGTEHTVRIVITMEQARKAGWTSNQAYAKTPQDMLWSRAAARVCDRIASDVLKGIASVEEIRDEIKATAEVGTRTVTPRKRTAPASIEGSVEEPPLDDLPQATAEHERAEAEPAKTDAPGITGPQQKKLHALLNEKGLGDRDLGLGFISQALGRDVETTKTLTKAEAGAVIEALDALGSDEPTLDADDWPPVAGEGT